LTSDNLIQEIPKRCGDFITTVMGGQHDHPVLELPLSYEKVQRLAIPAAGSQRVGQAELAVKEKQNHLD
jgi:hypothetical protein